MSRSILSFDCANQTLGVVLLTFNTEEEEQTKKLCKFLSHYKPSVEKLDELRTILGMINTVLSGVVIRDAWLFKLIREGFVRDVPEVDRIGLLKHVLQFVRRESERLVGHIDYVVVEHQMGDLEKSVYSAIVYEFQSPKSGAQILLQLGSVKANLDTKNEDENEGDDERTTQIINIHPTYKNSFHFHPSLCYSSYLEKYKTLKGANKAHTTENFLYYLQIFQPAFLAEQMKKGEINHLADAFMQGYYCVYRLI
jgi:hypothetical protein